MHSYAYSYNEDGLRLRKTVNNETTEYYYNGSVLMYMVTGSGSTAIRQRLSYDAAGVLAAGLQFRSPYDIIEKNQRGRL